MRAFRDLLPPCAELAQGAFALRPRRWTHCLSQQMLTEGPLGARLWSGLWGNIDGEIPVPEKGRTDGYCREEVFGNTDLGVTGCARQRKDSIPKQLPEGWADPEVLNLDSRAQKAQRLFSKHQWLTDPTPDALNHCCGYKCPGISTFLKFSRPESRVLSRTKAALQKRSQSACLPTVSSVPCSLTSAGCLVALGSIIRRKQAQNRAGPGC